MKTEIEAKGMLCPLLPFEITNGKCAGSSCMMWRWESQSDYFDRSRGASNSEKPIKHGYCGLAGKQERY